MRCVFAISFIIHFSFIYFVILSYSFYYFKWAFVCYSLASFLMLAHFAAYFGQFFLHYKWFFLSHPFVRRCLVQSQFMHIFYVTFYAVFMCSYWLWMVKCHFIVLAIILITYSGYPILNSSFIVFLAALS